MTPQDGDGLLRTSPNSLPMGQAPRLRPAYPLFQCWPQVSFRIRRARHILLLLDFDGTLTPLHDRPEEVQLGKATRQTLRQLVQHRRVALSIVSGRRHEDLQDRIGVGGVQYFGLHGWEGRDGMSLATRSEWLLFCARLLLTKMPPLPGIHLEDKEMSLAMHFRKAPAPATRELRTTIRDLVDMLGPDGLHVVEGSNVLELLPPEIPGKGAAVRNIVRGLPLTLLPIYVGNDPSDESAFAALPAGITVHVGDARHTTARYSLRDPGEVRSFLQRLEGELS
jgi:trehalose 6-phosphate phosphatase